MMKAEATKTSSDTAGEIPSVERWAEIEKYLKQQRFLHLVFQVGAHKVNVHKNQIAENRLALLVYIDGQILGKDMVMAADDAPREIVRKVWRRREFSVFKPSQRNRLEKGLGKRRALELFPNLHAKRYMYVPDFNTAKSLVRQFKKVEDLQLLEMA